MTKEIPLTQGRVALVDNEDYAALSAYRWHYHNSGYAARRVGHGGRYIFMHDQILEVERGVDHKNRVRLDNRRSNLRLATRSLNVWNRVSKPRDLPRGVQANGSGFCVRFYFHRTRYYLGQFKTPEEASHAYREKMFELRGEYPPE